MARESIAESRLYYLAVLLLISVLVPLMFMSLFCRECGAEQFNGCSSFIKFLMETPKRDFLGDVVAFCAASLSVMVPLGIAIVYQISEKFKSDLLAREFVKSKLLLCLVLLLAATLVMAIWLHGRGDTSQSNWSPFAWLVQLLTLADIVLLVCFFYSVLHFFDAEDLAIKLDGRCRRALMNADYEEYADTIEAFGDILVTECDRRKDATVLRILNIVTSHIDVALVENRPNDAILFSSLVDKFTSQLARVHHQASISASDEVRKSVHTTYSQLIEHYFKFWNVMQIIGSANSLLKADIKANASLDGGYDVIWFASAYSNKKLSISIFESFLGAYWNVLKLVATLGQEEALIATLKAFRSTPRRYNGPVSIWKLLKLCQQSADCSDLVPLADWLKDCHYYPDRVHSVRQLEPLIDTLNFIRIEIEKRHNHSAAQRTDLIIQCRNEFFDLHVSRALNDLMFSFGAFCLFKRKFSLIQYMWNLANPPDADGYNFTSFDQPQTISELLAYYVNNVDMTDSRYSLNWQDNHGATRHFAHYTLIRLAFLIQKNRPIELPRLDLRQKLRFKTALHQLLHDAQSLVLTDDEGEILGIVAFNNMRPKLLSVLHSMLRHCRRYHAIAVRQEPFIPTKLFTVADTFRESFRSCVAFEFANIINASAARSLPYLESISARASTCLLKSQLIAGAVTSPFQAQHLGFNLGRRVDATLYRALMYSALRASLSQLLSELNCYSGRTIVLAGAVACAQLQSILELGEQQKKNFFCREFCYGASSGSLLQIDDQQFSNRIFVVFDEHLCTICPVAESSDESKWELKVHESIYRQNGVTVHITEDVGRVGLLTFGQHQYDEFTKENEISPPCSVTAKLDLKAALTRETIILATV